MSRLILLPYFYAEDSVCALLDSTQLQAGTCCSADQCSQSSTLRVTVLGTPSDTNSCSPCMSLHNLAKSLSVHFEGRRRRAPSWNDSLGQAREQVRVEIDRCESKPRGCADHLSRKRLKATRA